MKPICVAVWRWRLTPSRTCRRWVAPDERTYATDQNAVIAAAGEIRQHWFDYAQRVAGEPRTRALAAVHEITQWKAEFEPRWNVETEKENTMATKTKAKTKTSNTRATSSLTEIALEAIDPHPDNPRKQFDKQGIADMARSLENEGQLQSCLVRPHPDPRKLNRFQMVCGHRRRMAALQAGFDFLKCEVRELSDADALVAMICENADREDLNVIETAEAIYTLTQPEDEGGAGFSDAEAGERFGKSESWAKNQKRLLALDGHWRLKIEKGLLPPTFARELIPYAHLPEVMEDMKRLDTDETSRDDFTYYLEGAIRECTRPIEKTDKPFTRYNNGRQTKYGARFKITDAIREELAVEEVAVFTDKGKRVFQRATNVVRWEELQREALRKEDAKKPGKTGGGQTDSPGNGKAEAGKPALTKAEIAAKKKQRAEQLERKIEEWRLRFLRRMCSELLEPESSQVQRLLVWISTGEIQTYRWSGIVGDVFPQPETKKYAPLWDRLAAVESDVPHCVWKCCVRVLWADECDDPCDVWLDGDMVEALAAELQIDLAKSWEDASNPRTSEYAMVREYLELHNKAELEAMIKKETAPKTKGSKADLVEALLEHHEIDVLSTPDALLKKKTKGRK